MKKYYCPDCGESFQPGENVPAGACADCPNCERPTWPGISFSFMWPDKLGEEIKRRSLTPYPIECHPGSPDFRAVQAAVNQGIDSHLEAVFFTQGSGDYGRECLVFNPESVPVLVRRLMESEDDNAQSLASSICETLGIELI